MPNQLQLLGLICTFQPLRTPWGGDPSQFSARCEEDLLTSQLQYNRIRLYLDIAPYYFSGPIPDSGKLPTFLAFDYANNPYLYSMPFP